MGSLLPTYKKAMVDELIYNISANNSNYYVFAANPVALLGNTMPTTLDDYSTFFSNDWNLLFGKKINSADIMPVIKNVVWVTNTVYAKYDNMSNTMYSNNFYVITPPVSPGGVYNIFKCIDNANGVPSTIQPDQIQSSSFLKSDGYIWRYVTSITSASNTKFSTTQYFPIYANNTLVSTAYNYSGVENVVVSNGGIGFISYYDGVVQSVSNSSLIQIDSSASSDNDYYTLNGIYIYNVLSATSQLRNVSKYVANSAGNWIFLDTSANVTNIIPTVTKYKISPKVVFNTDGDSIPLAYSVVNTFSNSISSVVMIDNGYGITRASVSIQSNTNYGSRANLYAICPPPGGHGSFPESELNMVGYCISFNFANNESNTIISNTVYNKIGIIKNPYTLYANNTKGPLTSANTFSQVLRANVSPSATFTMGETITGSNSNARGVVAFSNSSVLYMVGDKNFINGEIIVSANGMLSTTININTLGDLYYKNLKPLYIQNINNVTRSNTQTESFKIIIQI